MLAHHFEFQHRQRSYVSGLSASHQPQHPGHLSSQYERRVSEIRRQTDWDSLANSADKHYEIVSPVR
jgi:hypothetical protein